MHEIESTGDESEDIRGRRDRKRKSVDKLSGAARRKLAKGATLKMNASKCLKLTSFLTKLPLVEPVKVSTEEFEDKPVSDDQHPTTSSSRPTEPNETETTPASGLEHNMQTDLEYEAVEEQPAEDIIQEPLLPESEFPTDPGLYINTSLTTRLVRKLCEIGPCQPGLNEPFQFPTDEFGRKFLVSWYTKIIGRGHTKEARQ